MFKTIKRGFVAFLAIVMVFSYWSVAVWAGTNDGSNYTIEVIDSYDGDIGSFTNLANHGKYVGGTIYMDQCGENIDNVRTKIRTMATPPDSAVSPVVFNDDNKTLVEGAEYVMRYIQNARDENYPYYYFNYFSVLHVKANNPSLGALNVESTDPNVLTDKHVCMWEMLEISSSTDKYFLMYICPQSNPSSRISISQGNDSGAVNVAFVKGIKLTEFFVKETEYIEQSQTSSVAGYGKMNVTDQYTNEVYSAYVIDDGYTFNYIPGDTMHFVIDRTKTDGGDTNDTMTYKLYRGNTEIPQGPGFTVVPDSAGSLNARVTISDEVAHQGDNLVLKIVEVPVGSGPDFNPDEDLSRPVICLNINVLNSNPVKTISFKQDIYELTTVENKTKDMSKEVVVSPNDYTDVVLYTSDDPSVATVDYNTGVVTAVGVGETYIRAFPKKNQSLIASCKIVVKKDLQTIQIDEPSMVVQGRQVEVVYSTIPTAAQGVNLQDIEWTSSNDNVLEVIGPDASGKVYVKAKDEAVLANGSNETVILTAKGKNGVFTEKAITVYQNTPSSDIVYAVELNGTYATNFQKSLVQLEGDSYKIYDGQSVKIGTTFTTSSSSSAPSSDLLVWRVTVEGTSIVNMELDEAETYFTYEYNPGASDKELIVHFKQFQNAKIQLIGYAIGENGGIDNPHAVKTLRFNVNKKTSNINTYYPSNNNGVTLDNVCEGKDDKGTEVVLKYILEENVSENQDLIHVVSENPSVLEVSDYSNFSRTGTIYLKAYKYGTVDLYLYSVYDLSLTTPGKKPTYYDTYRKITVNVRRNIDKAVVVQDISNKVFKNEPYSVNDIKDELAIKYDGNDLVWGNNYSLDLSNNRNAGICTVTIKGIGASYGGTKTVSFNIDPYSITNTSQSTVSTINVNGTHTYSGLDIKPGVTLNVKKFSTNLRQDNDYFLVYDNNINAGNKASVMAVGVGNYTGIVMTNFTINPANVSEMNIANIPDEFYNGKEHKPDIPATNSKTGDKLNIGIDYHLEYLNNVNKGKATIKVTGEGNYTGTREAYFEIRQATIADTTISSIPDQTFTFGEALRPPVTVTFDGKTLVEGTDYRIDYRDNYNAGTATVVFIGSGDFGGETTRTFKINPYKLTASNTTVTVEELTYDGTARKPSVNVVLKSTGKPIDRNDEGNRDFKVTYSNNVNSGNGAKVTITGTKNFTGSFDKNFTIKGYDIDRVGVEGIPEQAYTGKAVKPKVKLTFMDKTLKEGTDYKLAYSDNIKSGEATITVTGLGNFYGTKIIRFRIKNAPVSFNTDLVKVVAGGEMRLPYSASESVSFSSSSKSICTVNSEGVVFAKMAGYATITAKSASGIKATIKVLVLYKDVQSDADFWYEPTYYLTDKGVAKGYDNQTNFKPGNECSRAQMVTFLWRLSGSPEPKTKSTTFKDVKSSDYFYKAVLWAVEKGITTGVSSKKFDPQGICTRAQTVTFLWRMAGKPNPKAKTSKFKDVKSSEYFYKATIWASEMKIVAGYDNGTFKPQGKCLRRQMVTFLYKYDKFVNGKG